MVNKLQALVLRGGGISGKFLLVFLLTRDISLEFQGAFSLMNTNVALLVIFIGFDFYAYSNRLIVKNPSELVAILKNSMVFFALAYLLLLPATYLLNLFELVSKDLVFLFIVLVILEHLSQELFRIYIAIERVVFANVLFFFKSGFWSWAIVLYMLLKGSDGIDLKFILSLWAISSFLAVCIGLFFIPGIKSFWSAKIDSTWIKKGIKVGLSIFLATVFLKIIEFSDRYLIDYFLGKTALGIYAFYFQLANLVNVIIFTLYISFIYPRIFRSVYDQDVAALKKNKSEIFISSTVIVAIFSVAFFIFLPYILALAGKSDLYDYQAVLYVLIASALLLNFSYSSHYVLIAGEKEKSIIITTLCSCIINVALNLLLIPQIGVIGAAIAAVIAAMTLWLTKTYAEKSIVNKWPK